MNSNKFKSTTAVLLLLVLTSFPSFAAGETKDDSSVQMDSLLTEIYPSDGPGASILVVKDGKTILRRAYGIGNLELNVPLSSKMVFRIGSVTKQFTSAGIMKMVEQGKLKVSDPITLYLPGYPTHGHNITIENLLTHTSGIKSYTSMGETMKEIVNEDLAVDELVDSFKDAPMDFAPSTAYEYSNSGYVLLGAIIEKISGKSYTDYIQDEFFTPLGMTSSYYGSFTKIIPNRAMGYQVTENGFLNAEYISMRIPYSAGSIVSSVDDLQRWTNALHSGKVVSEESYQKMTTPFVLSNGKNAGSDKSGQGYGYALNVTDLKGHRKVGHGGGIDGFKTMVQWIDDEKLLVVVLSNTGNPVFSPSSIANQLSAIAMGQPFKQPKSIRVKSSILKKYTGEYTIEKYGAPVTVSYEDGRLYIKVMGGIKKRIQPYTKTSFFINNDLARYSFSGGKNGKATEVRLHQAESSSDNELIAVRNK